MLNDLKGYEYLGSPNFFYALLEQMTDSDKDDWSIRDINYMFANKMIDGRMDFNGCLAYARTIGLLVPVTEKSFSYAPSFKDYIGNKEDLQDKILEHTFVLLKESKEALEMFIPENISYDVIYDVIEIKNSAFKFSYANLKQLLLDFEFMYPHPDINHFIVNQRYKKLFDLYVLPLMKEKKFSIDELLKSLEQKRVYGEEAEKFVVEFEKRRLERHKSIQKIQKISDYDVSAGYDVVSFNTELSKDIDRFIEVKSFAGKDSFYWSRNEIEVAKIKRDAYFLYLVDRSKVNIENYTPVIIQDPYKNVLKDETWTRTVEKYFITRQSTIKKSIEW